MLRKAAFFSFSSSYLTMLIQFVSVMIVVRLLSPEEMGVFALSVSFVAVLRVLRDFGVSQYIVQEADLKDDYLRAAFAVTLGFGWTLAILVYWLFSPLAGMFYESPAVADVLKLLALSFLLFPFGATSLAMLRRELNFAARLKVELSSSIVKASVAILCAYNGLSYMSLAWATVAESLAIVIGATLVRPAQLPFWPGVKGIRHVFSTSWKLAGGGVLKFLGEAAPALIVGKVLGLQAVGLLDRGIATVNIFNHLLSKSLDAIVLPYFSLSSRSGSTLKTEYLKGSCIVTGLAWPFYVFLAFESESVIHLLYGINWVVVAPVVAVLSIAQLLSFSCHLFDMYNVAQERSGLFIKLQGIWTLLRVLLILLFSHQGLMFVAWAFVLVSLVRLLVTQYLLASIDRITTLDFYRSHKPSLYLMLAFLLAEVLFYNVNVWNDIHLFFQLAIKGVILSLIWLWGVYFFKHPFAEEISRMFVLVRNRVIN